MTSFSVLFLPSTLAIRRPRPWAGLPEARDLTSRPLLPSEGWRDLVEANAWDRGPDEAFCVLQNMMLVEQSVELG